MVANKEFHLHTNWYVLIGYMGSLLVGLSMTMSNIKTLRIINLFGASTFLTYGILIKAYPVCLLNSFIVSIDIYYLIRMKAAKDYFAFNETLKGHEFFLNEFFKFFASDIKTFFPQFNLNSIKTPKFTLTSRNMNPVGLLVYEHISESQIFVHLDYVRPEYRDFKNAHSLYSKKIPDFKSQGVKEITCRCNNQKHQKYLRKMGFTMQMGTSDEFSFKL